MVKRFSAASLSTLWVSSHKDVRDFYLTSWQPGESAIPMLVLRIFTVMAATTILTWSLVEGMSPHWLVFLTNWGILLVAMMTLTGLVVSLSAACKKIPDENVLPWYVALYWLFYNVSVPIAIIITTLFWVLLYDPDAYTDADIPEAVRQRLFWLDIATHGFTSCISVLELVMARTPLRLLHFYQPLGLGLWYAVFSAIFYLAGGTVNGEPYIYEILDWRQERRAGIIVGISTAGLIVVYIALWAIAFFRDAMSNAFVRTTSKNLAQVPPDQYYNNTINFRIA